MPNNQPASLQPQTKNQPDSQPAQPSTHTKQTKLNRFNVLLLLATVLFLTIAGYHYFQLQTQLNQALESLTVLEQAQSVPTDTLEDDFLTEPADDPNQIISSPVTDAIECPALPLVVFEPPLATDEYQPQRVELQRKVVDPLIDYHQHIYGKNDLVSVMLSLEITSEFKEEFPYYLTALSFKGGQTWRSLSQTDGVLDWWTAPCMGKCDFSAEFREKYPEVVRLSE
jgi:hypothetical protein